MNFMKPVLGFSTGSLGELGLAMNKRLEFCLELGCNAVEIGYAKKERFHTEPLAEIDLSLIKRFSYVSLHAPGSRLKFDRKNPEARAVLEEIQSFHNKHSVQVVVFHPDSFEDFSILQDYSFPVGIENMDNRKVSFQTEATLQPIFEINPNFNFVLDINHCFVNDNTMALAKKLFVAFKTRLQEIHVSGFIQLHEALHQTKQKEFLRIVAVAEYPVIIESMLASKAEAEAEYNYILENL